MITFNQRLAHKLSLFSIGLYGAVVSLFGLLYLFSTVLGLNQLVSVFIGFFITVFWRAIYDQVVIYELRVGQLNYKNNAILALIGASVMAPLYYYIRMPLGDWAVPLALLISMKVIAMVKSYLWPRAHSALSEFFNTYNQKLQIYLYGLYGFFFAVALITYGLVKIFGLPYFYLVFAAALVVALFGEQIYEMAAIYLYLVSLTAKKMVCALCVAIISAVFCSGLVFVLMQIFGFSGKAATIIGIIAIKLVQPWMQLFCKNH